MKLKYIYSKEFVPQDKRTAINTAVLELGDISSSNITLTDVFNGYTGDGGLHGLNFKDYDNYHSYSSAKKEIENGQFFTPHPICHLMANLVSNSSTVLDPCCGMGNFFNYFPEQNCYGCDTDHKAIQVAQRLYPDANIEIKDMRSFDVKVDCILSNPPFNIDLRCPYTHQDKLSQFVFFEVCARRLKPGGILIAVVPASFLNDEFLANQIKSIEAHYSFIGQLPLKPSVFKQMGCANFATKIVAFQLREDEKKPYSTEYTTYEELHQRIKVLEAEGKDKRLERRRQLLSTKSTFNFQVKKYLFEIGTHPAISEDLQRAQGYLIQFKEQVRPDDMPYEDWCKIRITEQRVLSYLQRIIKKQSPKKKLPGIRKVKTRYGIKNKADHHKDRKGLNVNYSPLHLAVGAGRLQKLVNRKFRAHQLQATSFDDLTPSKEIVKYVKAFSFLNKKKEKCKFTKIQRQDIAKTIIKPYCLEAWQMGCGKTAATYAWAEYQKMKNTFVVSTALSISSTWAPFLKLQDKSFVIVKSITDLEKVEEGDYILLSFHYLGKPKKGSNKRSSYTNKLHRQLKKFIKLRSQKCTLIFDESDEIRNPLSAKTKNITSIFSRLKRKILATGTTTRNNIAELYPQLRLLYNNSWNMTCKSQYMFKEDKEGDLKQVPNPRYGKPFDAKHGRQTFVSCHSPTKTTVLGIKQFNQDIRNKEELSRIIESTIITRLFKEIAGDKYKVKNVTVQQNMSERHVYRSIVKDLSQLIREHFGSTGNARKDAALRIMLQLKLLIKACSMPQTFSQYAGSSAPGKVAEILKLVKETNEKIAIGSTNLDAVAYYAEKLKATGRPIFIVTGKVPMKKRQPILDKFEATDNGILISTQQSLSSSINVPSCNKVIAESLPWNIPTLMQWVFRFVRFDSLGITDITIVTYDNTIECNLLALLMAKEKLNDFIKTMEDKTSDAFYEEFGVSQDILNSIIEKQKDEEGKVSLRWGTAYQTPDEQQLNGQLSLFA